MTSNSNSNDNWLPSFPAVGLRVLQLLSSEEAGIDELAAAIRDDTAITAKILKFANSPLFGSRSEVATIEHAISWLGKKQVSAIALSFSLSESRTSDPELKSYFDNFWLQSFVGATAFECMANSIPTLDSSQAYVAGILMGIGQLVLLDSYPSGYSKIIRESANGRPLDEIETAEMGITSSEIGFELLESLNLPRVYSIVTKYHVCPLNALASTEDDEHRDYILAGRAASAYVDFFCFRDQAKSLIEINRLLSRFDFSKEHVDWLLEDVRKRCEEKAEIYNAKISSIPSNADLLSAAVQQLLEVEAATIELDSSYNDRKEQKIEAEAIRARIANLGIVDEQVSIPVIDLDANPMTTPSIDPSVN